MHEHLYHGNPHRVWKTFLAALPFDPLQLVLDDADGSIGAARFESALRTYSASNFVAVTKIARYVFQFLVLVAVSGMFESNAYTGNDFCSVSCKAWHVLKAVCKVSPDIVDRWHRKVANDWEAKAEQ